MGYPLDRAAMQDAFAVAESVGLTAKGGERTRRPTLDELDRLMTHFGEVRSRRSDSIPMQRIIAFAEEIVTIRWSDYDGKRVLVRDMKHPGQKAGNGVMVDLPPEASAIIDSMPRVDDRIFPFSTDAVSAAFTRACKFLTIDDVHFHDLRHEGCSRLFELGWTIPQVATVSGHRSWQSLKRYSHLRQTGDKFAGWKWMAP
jgi:integrase